MEINKDDMKDMDFSFLEGKVVNMTEHGAHGVVIGCDYHVGVSIMDISKDKYLFCLRGPSSWRAKGIKSNTENQRVCSMIHYDITFHIIVNQIIEGTFCFDDPFSKGVDHVTSDDCSFI